MFKRPLALAAATLYVTMVIGLAGGIGVMASGAPTPHETAGHEVGFALIMMLNK
ncbi:hypothetical protein [Salinarimonas ramus]|uniref:Uncharacterized protein n=1 Tax=Salinarimonas ramus TaxID=690164 RepID=A0A917QIQ8_9HYPH|nr:hypothetical protein [Salinarimonas ramus]GGK52209.1 hypothetical protein GCM10011322_43950 [Salinarimonas ramus]